MNNLEQKIESKAISLLKKIYRESSMENEFDYEIFKFLKTIGEIPQGEQFYNKLVEYGESGN